MVLDNKNKQLTRVLAPLRSSDSEHNGGGFLREGMVFKTEAYCQTAPATHHIHYNCNSPSRIDLYVNGRNKIIVIIILCFVSLRIFLYWPRVPQRSVARRSVCRVIKCFCGFVSVMFKLSQVQLTSFLPSGFRYIVFADDFWTIYKQDSGRSKI